MTRNNVNKFDGINVAVQDGDITRIPANAILTAINSGGRWFRGINGAISKVAGKHYHNQAGAKMPFSDLQIIVAKGNKENHNGLFDDIVFVVDDLQSSLDEVIYKGLEASHNEAYERILIPPIRMGVMAGVRESPEEAVKKMGEGLERFMKKYSDKTKLQDISFVVYKDGQTQERLTSGLRNLKQVD